MKNDEFIIIIDAIIEYLKKNGGYKHRLYNHTCPLYDKEPDSNIVEYARDIKDFYLNTYNYDSSEEFIISEICTIIEDNLKMFLLSDNKLLKMKFYCKDKIDCKYGSTPYDLIIEFVEEALLDLLNTEHLYDYRDIK